MSISFPDSQHDLANIADRARRLADALDRLAADGRPTPNDLAVAPVLDAWMIARRHAPALVGAVCGHPSIGNDRLTITSELFAIDPNGRWARTWSRYYRLADAIPSGHGRRQ